MIVRCIVHCCSGIHLLGMSGELQDTNVTITSTTGLTWCLRTETSGATNLRFGGHWSLLSLTSDFKFLAYFPDIKICYFQAKDLCLCNITLSIYHVLTTTILIWMVPTIIISVTSPVRRNALFICTGKLFWSALIWGWASRTRYPCKRKWQDEQTWILSLLSVYQLQTWGGLGTNTPIASLPF